eukprot:m.112760 g.112760  ORF g.112760 m.112760 type:complete len:82 (-) comp14100_c0_seq3:506-751(-)
MKGKKSKPFIDPALQAKLRTAALKRRKDKNVESKWRHTVLAHTNTRKKILRRKKTGLANIEDDKNSLVVCATKNQRLLNSC